MPSNESLHSGFTSARPWLPVPDVHLARNVDLQEAQPDSALRRLRRFLGWREQHPALMWGVRLLPAPEPVLAFERRDDADAVRAYFNTGAQAIAIALDEASAITTIEGHGLVGGSIEQSMVRLPAYGALFAKAG